LKNLLANQKPTEAKKEYVATPISVFFNLGKSAKVASKRDLVNVEALAKYAKDNNANLLVTGYADSATGSKNFNQKISENRANTVADHLVKMGVNRDNIKTAAKGGVADLSPVSFNRRATVEVAE
jgi:outer membrane protein OmpA-like peptidoglycan-associated protein